MLSAYGPLLWFTGFPSSYWTNNFRGKIRLFWALDSTLLWESEEYFGEYSLVGGLYYNWAREFEGYPALAADAFETWIKNLMESISVTSESGSALIRKIPIDWSKATAKYRVDESRKETFYNRD